MAVGPRQARRTLAESSRNSTRGPSPFGVAVRQYGWGEELLDIWRRRSRMTEGPVDRFEAAFKAHHRAVLAYALRRTKTEADAEDAVAETFAVAWRRIDHLPDAESALPWLLAVARRVLANQRRSVLRRVQLGLRLRAEPQQPAAPFGTGGPVIWALEQLHPDDQELLRLLAWDGLSHAEAGQVLGISANAVAIRLHRARRRFAAELSRRGAKGFASSRTSERVEGRMPGRTHEERAP